MCKRVVISERVCFLVTSCDKHSTEDNCRAYECVAQQTGCSVVAGSIAHRFCLAVHHNAHPHHLHQRHQQQQLLHPNVSAAFFVSPFTLITRPPSIDKHYVFRCARWPNTAADRPIDSKFVPTDHVRPQFFDAAGDSACRVAGSGTRRSGCIRGNFELWQRAQATEAHASVECILVV